MFKTPKNDSKYQWTSHVTGKMAYYGISESLIKRIVRFPKRKEEGIAPGTVAVMQPGSNKKKPSEIWVMYQEIKSRQNPEEKNKIQLTMPKKRIISAWRYPGISPEGKEIPIPDEIRQELEDLV
ncbi:MAG: Uncharacterized protein CEN90_777 [Parcubacteria group bacterium Licking1014_17]|nr:MAG: Uncharacterized protein CEN90_777 [Parcubacteria group bacterium Licking1014_17]